MQRDRYPKNWPEVAHAVKDAANWQCQGCGRRCRKPGEAWETFILAAQGWELDAIDFDKPQRFTLTVAHLDQNPANNDPANIKALCAPCHLNYDRPFWRHNRDRKREHRGQQTIHQIGLVDAALAGHGKRKDQIQLPIPALPSDVVG